MVGTFGKAGFREGVDAFVLDFVAETDELEEEGETDGYLLAGAVVARGAGDVLPDRDTDDELCLVAGALDFGAGVFVVEALLRGVVLLFSELGALMNEGRNYCCWAKRELRFRNKQRVYN